MMQGTETEYIPRDDESEAFRSGNLQGVGEVTLLDDNAVREYSMSDYGLQLREDEFK